MFAVLCYKHDLALKQLYMRMHVTHCVLPAAYYSTHELYLQVLLLLLHSAQLSHLPSHFLPNGHLESMIQVHVMFQVCQHYNIIIVMIKVTAA